MSNIDQTAVIPSASSVFRLFLPEHLPATLMLAGGVTLYAVESYIMATIAPSIVRDVGGLALFSWVTSLFVAAAVLGSIFVAMRPRGIGLRSVYVIAALVFGAGSLIAAAAPSMPVVLIGRAVQGLGTGALAALGYAFIRFVYPEPLWPKASTLYAAIWGVSTVIGPTLGGFFSSGHAWRYAFIVLVPLGPADGGLGATTVARRRGRPRAGKDAGRPDRAAACRRANGECGRRDRGDSHEGRADRRFGRRGRRHDLHRGPKPEPAAALRRRQSFPADFTGLPGDARHDRRSLVSDVFIPYFLQTLHGVPAIVSGYLVALVALGWTLAAFLSGSWTDGRAYWAIVIGALIEAAATACLAVFLAKDNPEGHMLIIVPAAIGMFMMGFGIGLGWAHLVSMVLKLVADNEKDKASAAIPTMSSLGGAFGAAFAGVIANGAGLVDPGGIPGALSAAHWLYLLMALPGVLAVAVSLTLSRRAA
ncbi:MFS transporter [Rhizobium changzhiense]|uniref:MFS transporter n=1 Tax=Rhizobium changzhiense TaxID=2692317 RepID=UPI001F0C976E|nr:MFS transporter [Rhizobium changzhiense]MCH4544824.1 MFS transporter [Rhizobium changzhiense]